MTSTQHIPESAPSSVTCSLGADVDRQRRALLRLRDELRLTQQHALSPAVARALEMAELYLFLGLGYLGHTDELFPGETPAT